MKWKDKYKVIGVMSGTSLDGLDLACCVFTRHKKKWKFRIDDAMTLPYPAKWKKALSGAHRLSGRDLQNLDASYGQLIGYACSSFIEQMNIRKVDFIASHGHTVFHQIGRGFTCQIGDGNAIYAETGIPVVYDFRRLDVALRGQGAPLVPVGDRYLFGDQDVCINLGGIANLSMEKKGARIAFDVCYANMGLNHLAEKKGLPFDKDGLLTARGKLHPGLLKALKETYAPLKKSRPSLAREGFEKDVQPLLDNVAIPLEDRLYTFCESVASAIAGAIPGKSSALKILVTGGGAFHPVLMKLIQGQLKKAVLTSAELSVIEFKEALVFAFLGVLRVRGEVNVLKSVTRAVSDSCSGAVVGDLK